MSENNYYGSLEKFREFVSRSQGLSFQEDSLGYKWIKKGFDLTASLGGLLLILPLIPFIVLLIKLETKGPVFFKQERVGYQGKLFGCYKFRSMAVDAEQRKEELAHLNEATGAAFKIKADPRITGVGSFLRRSSLDEFPQLFNILKGDMSVIGPRPQIPSEVADYTPEQAQRLLVKPGLTCLWQVSGRSHLDFQEWMELDREYVKKRNLFFDFKILARTLPAVIERKGAY